MNPTAFSELLTDISDEYIVSAANPRSKPVHWYHLTAVAACIVLLISAAVYPKLKIQAPAVQPPAESVVQESTADTEATETVTTQTVPSASGKTDTAPTTSAAGHSSAKTTDTETVPALVTEQTQTTAAATATVTTKTTKATKKSGTGATMTVMTTTTTTEVPYTTTTENITTVNTILTTTGNFTTGVCTTEVPETATGLTEIINTGVAGTQNEQTKETVPYTLTKTHTGLQEGSYDPKFTAEVCFIGGGWQITLQKPYADAVLTDGAYDETNQYLWLTVAAKPAKCADTVRFFLTLPETNNCQDIKVSVMLSEDTADWIFQNNQKVDIIKMNP